MNATATTPATIGDQYAKALERAKRSGVGIMGRGHRKSDNAPVIAVSSSRVPNRFYLVAVLPDRLACDCPAGSRGKMCQHRATVHELLIAEWRKERDRVESLEVARLRQALANLSRWHCRLDEAIRAACPPRREDPGDAPTVTQQEAAALLQHPPRRPALLGAAGADAPLYRDNRAVSIWKS